ncbi:MAG: dihydropteroate synthase [Saprospiraceae bacterium]|nr:dihydropteroate synthase [Saprospiraceae bacterium]
MIWPQTTLNCRGTLLDLKNPVVMGIINTTPDSFYKGSRFQFVEETIKRVGEMITEGVAVIDIGGMSSRPGAGKITPQEEIERLKPVLSAVRETFPDQIISVDTVWSAVARWALDLGVHMINDISGWQMDPLLLDVIAEYRVPYVLMHMKGTPETMQLEAHYNDVVIEVVDFLIQKLGVLMERDLYDIIVDPGFGFAKTSAHNFELLQNLHALQILEKPVLAGLSRKSTIQNTLRVEAEDTLNGTTAMNMVALQQGAKILRVHDVKEAMECIKLYNQLKRYDRTKWL